MQCSFAAISITDLDDIVEIEKSAFICPWNLQSLLNELDCEDVYAYAARTNYSGSDSSLIGYIFFRLIFEEMHILKIAVDDKYRDQGIATGLIKYGVHVAISSGASWVLLEVRPSNRVAISFYRKLGFTIIGKRKQYYLETGEDALVMYSNLKQEPNIMTYTGR